MAKIESLGPFQYEVLSIIMRYPKDAYGLVIIDRMQEDLKREINIGSTYTTLKRLEDKGLIESKWSVSTHTRGGRRKRLYKINAAGRAAITQFERYFNLTSGSSNNAPNSEHPAQV